MSLGRLGGAYAALHAGQQVADYIVQRDSDAKNKGEPGPTGRHACASHVVGVVATQAVCLAIACAATGERLSLPRTVLGLTVSGLTHYAADRKDEGVLPWLERRLDKEGFSKMGVVPATGRNFIDQAWHQGCQFAAAALIAGRRP